MSNTTFSASMLGIGMLFICSFVACEKKQVLMEETKMKAPVRTYIVTARIDRKGTNSNSVGTAVLKGTYNESTKAFSYAIEYQQIDPVSIALRSGGKGTIGSLIREVYNVNEESGGALPVKGGFVLSPLQERNLLRGLWFVAINTSLMSPEISGVLTLKQQQ